MKLVAAGSVSKSYQTNLYAKLSKSLLENVNFDLIYPIFIIQKPARKITRYGVHLPVENVVLLRGLQWCKLSTTKLGFQ